MQISPTIRRVLCIAFFACCLCKSRADEPIRWKFKAGDRLGYNIEQELTISSVEGGTDKLQSRTHQQLDVTWQVRNVKDNGDAVILYEFERIRSQMTLPSGKLDYDSAKEGPPAGMAAINASLYTALRKSPVEIVVSPTGITQSVTLPEGVQAALKRVQTAPVLGDLAKPDVFQTRFLPGFPLLKAGTVEPGAEWSVKSTADLGPAGAQLIETKYRYDGRKDIDDVANAAIRVRRSIEFQPGESSQRRVKEQTSEGDVIFDLVAGRLRSSTLTQHATIAITAGEQQVEQKIDQSIVVKYVFAPPKALMDGRKQ